MPSFYPGSEELSTLTSGLLAAKTGVEGSPALGLPVIPDAPAYEPVPSEKMLRLPSDIDLTH
jgi:hypothetical protein